MADLSLGQYDRRARRPLPREGDHLFAVIQTGRACALRESVPKQKTAPAT